MSRLFPADCLPLLALACLASFAGAEVLGGRFEQLPCPLARELCLGSPSAHARLTSLRNGAGDRHKDGPGDGPTQPLPLNKTLVYVRTLLQEACMVEHSTVPLYLTALYSIANGSAYAARVIHGVVIEEMLHMTIAANVLNAIGGAPAIDTPNFIPRFPMQLPMTNVSVAIRRFDRVAARNFMLVESTTAMDKSIGSSYEYVLSLITALVDGYGEAAVFTGNAALQVRAVAQGGAGQLQVAPQIYGLNDTINALLGVSDQGGGCPVPGHEQYWPDLANISAGPLGGVLSHYARFAQVHAGRAFRDNDTLTGGPTGAPLVTDWEGVHDFAPNPTVADFPEGSEARARALAFAGNYTALLAQLHNVFNGQPGEYFATLGAMHTLAVQVAELMQTPDPRNASRVVGPTWEYVPAASQYALRGGKARPLVVS